MVELEPLLLGRPNGPQLWISLNTKSSTADVIDFVVLYKTF